MFFYIIVTGVIEIYWKVSVGIVLTCLILWLLYFVYKFYSKVID